MRLLISIEKQICKCSNWKESVIQAPAAGNSALSHKSTMPDADAAATNPNGIKTLFANGLSTFSLKTN